MYLKKIYLKSLLKDLEIWKHIDELRIPTLIIVPQFSPVFRNSASRKLSNNKYISIKRINNSTHLFPLENPTSTSKIILDFLAI